MAPESEDEEQDDEQYAEEVATLQAMVRTRPIPSNTPSNTPSPLPPPHETTTPGHQHANYNVPVITAPLRRRTAEPFGWAACIPPSCPP